MTTAVKNPSHARFPIGLPIAAAIVTGLGPLAAVLNIYFSADTRSDSVNLAWTYSNICLACVTMLLWPAVAMMERRAVTALDPAAILLASIPAMALSFWLSSPREANVIWCVLLQVALASAMYRALLWSRPAVAPSHAKELSVVIAVCVLTLGVPPLMYLQMEFLGGSTLWSSIGPLVAVSRVAAGGREVVVTFMYLLAGLIFFVFSARKS